MTICKLFFTFDLMKFYGGSFYDAIKYGYLFQNVLYNYLAVLQNFSVTLSMTPASCSVCLSRALVCGSSSTSSLSPC